MKQTKARLLLAEDNSNVLEEIRELLSRDFDLVATAKDGLELLAAAETYKPDIVVTDISMPHLSGIDATKRLLELGYCKAVVIFSNNENADIARAAFAAGASAYVVKEHGEELINGIHAAIRGKLFLSPHLQA